MPYKDPVKARENSRKRSMLHYWRNRERLIEKMRVFRENNPDKMRACWSNWYKKNREEKCKYHREYRIKNKSYFKAYDQMKRKKYGRVSKETIQAVYEENIKKFGTLTCVLCDKRISFGEDSLEHLLPLSRGGTHDINNLAVAHLSCNKIKHNKTFLEYKEKSNVVAI